MEFDTIAAISTPPGEGAIAIIRLSGPEAIQIADRIFYAKNSLSEAESHTIHYGHIKEDGEVIEEVMVTVMRAPRTFTREDVVEINAHGGIVSVNRVLQLLLRNGANLAEPGEFTKRAFLNGRIDLSQAEAVMDLIRAKTDRAMGVAIRQMDGNLSRLIRNLRQEILDALAQVEVNIDYPEYDDVEEMTQRMLLEKTELVRASVEQLLQTASQGKILREGLATAIIGRPNVGKSSLLNQLIQEEKAIVTDIAGTTRDIIEEYVNVRGVPLRLIDTAGIRETEDIVEKIGVERSRKALADADFILLVLNQNEELTVEDEALFEAAAGYNYVVVLNKTDLETKLDIDRVRELAGENPIVSTSLVNDEGLEALEEAIKTLFFAGDIDAGDATYVSNVRHIALLHQALEALNGVTTGIQLGMPVDIVQIDMTRAWDLLGEITGDSVQDELLDQLFNQFCLGK
ncbi:tRNA uridine-5-carboxymethylaminomethyl(34) synthesis GTPase MnmE [Listeria monocytogenes]|uniref:tRNA uridine-5-carboxymethylaminomethyl(34) synthesis GTPase MnmE n=1 Tax=Listeria monocytogenes TaxID=1639 RepID=UPI00083E594C|nr:tRNA uridine-5-carboxymethylaminomethyl(34) synthesis GTPase MnmE [Listeria monocytogenes]EAE6152246.1 tRNA uridine-5-carboxymethylaminomethyl(34) synthesis GTPase MnmE [Listeria monocytogenes serotype 1/2a]EAD8643350.1 tRNA uridine-5-carboxymethylaminomethyl(34) synthesis GTPase MnmE [Listeria monocytogenes]EAE5346201.1 tRNA uridine-5-carboxymethylaminomethyl(34) synthesis GTPase MnmE [Listeria monocytogenes]EAG7363162.1 tRNA uridine-5-carboxymethylaminomethyl(34) synthesis GTPase MnmE [Lis